MSLNNYINKKIAVLGLGAENFALLKFLLKSGAENITVCDQKGKEELKGSLELKDESITWRTGENYLGNLKDYEIIFRTPGLPYFHPKIFEAKNAGVTISSETKLFFELCPSPIIGVTGTKGKGTTTALIGEILKKDGKRVWVGGNIGTPPITFLSELTKNDVVILELSSFQLQDLEQSPHIAVVLDIKVDHLDHHASREEYLEAKKNIVRYQSKHDMAVINADYQDSQSFGVLTPGKKFFFSRKKELEAGAFVADGKIVFQSEGKTQEIIEKSNIQLRGEHNLENICAAAAASILAGAKLSSVSDGIRSFRGLEHRLEFTREVGKVKYYNDSFSTTPDTTIAAIKSFTEPVILLVGGSEKKSDYAELGKVISNSNIKQIIAIGLTAKRIIEYIENSKIEKITEIQSLQDAIALAGKTATSGDVVLLSPASASFDKFKNYKERGNIFKQLVNQL